MDSPFGGGYYGTWGRPDSLADVLARLSSTGGPLERALSGWPAAFESPFAALARAAFASPKSLQLEWNRCHDGQGNLVWGPLATVDLSHEHFRDREGVYVIWSAATRRGIRVGKGIIRQRLQEHRNEWWAAALGADLLVSWADVPARHRDGVERYLADTLHPVIGDKFPSAAPIEVNLPL